MDSFDVDQLQQYLKQTLDEQFRQHFWSSSDYSMVLHLRHIDSLETKQAEMLLKFTRNLCIESEKAHDAHPEFVAVLTNCLNTIDHDRTKFILQSMCNWTQSRAQEGITWLNDCEKTLIELLQNHPHHLFSFVSMMVYNTIKGVEFIEHQDLFLRWISLLLDHFHHVIQEMTQEDHQLEPDASFLLLITEFLLKHGHFEAVYHSIFERPSSTFELSTRNHLAAVNLMKLVEGCAYHCSNTGEIQSTFSMDTLVFLRSRLLLLLQLAEDEEWWMNDLSHSHVLIFKLLLTVLCRIAAISPSSLAFWFEHDLEVISLILQTMKQMFKFSTIHPAKRQRTAPASSFNVLSQMTQLLANFCHEHLQIQDAIREYEGIPLILSLCNFDDHNPHIREWGILCVRNLCRHNLENQKVIADLKSTVSTQVTDGDVEMVVDDLGNVSLKTSSHFSN